MSSIYRYFDELDASEDLRLELRNYYSVLWRRKAGLTYSAHLYQLPTSLQMELMFDVNFAYLRRSLLFQDLPEPILRRLSLVRSLF